MSEDSPDPTIEKLYAIRTRKDLKLKKPDLLKDTFTDFDGTEKPLKLRHYQIQAALHISFMDRFVLGDDCGLGKTLETITGLCSIWQREPKNKVLVLTTKSATNQWALEFPKFTSGVTVFKCPKEKAARTKIIQAWQEFDGPCVLIMNYAIARRDFTELQDLSGFTLVADEATAFKNIKTAIHSVCAHLAKKANRVYGLTATLIKNNLLEGHAIYNVITPGLFGSYNHFLTYYCIVEMLNIGRGRRIAQPVGYYPEKVKEFRETIKPFFLGRAKHEVATELPTLLRQSIEVDISEEQNQKYQDALNGLLRVHEGTENEEDKETTKLTALIYCQQIVNHPDLIGCEGDSEKLEALEDLLTDGDFAGEKVIIFTRFRKMVDIIVPVLNKAGVKTVRITGSESSDERLAAQAAFQNLQDETKVVVITMAGSDAINLQAAKAIVFYDSPWSAGDYIQILGRMIRIGSRHDQVHAVHLLACRKHGDGKTIDHKVMGVLSNKMALIEGVLGERIQGMTDGDNACIKHNSSVQELFDLLKEG